MPREKTPWAPQLEETPETPPSSRPGAQEGKILELEQKCTEILEQGRFEREKLLSIQQQLTCRLRAVEEEHRSALELVRHLQEVNGELTTRLELERHSGGPTAEIPAARQLPVEGLQVENGSLQASLENEEQKTGPWFGSSPAGGHCNLFQCSCLENPMHKEAWQATVHAVTKSWT